MEHIYLQVSNGSCLRKSYYCLLFLAHCRCTFLPSNGTSADALLTSLEGLAANDADWRNGRTFSLVFYPGAEVEELIKKAYTRFFMENGLSPASFRSLGWWCFNTAMSIVGSGCLIRK